MKIILPPATIGRLFLQTVQTIILVRHAKAPKTSPEQKDEDRQINQLGHDQAKKLGLKLQTFEFDAVLSSPLQRVKQTLAIATNSRYPVIEVPELTCPTGGHPIDIMFNELGYVPMAKYFKHPLGNHLKWWGQKALEAVVGSLSPKPNQTVLVGGHAVLQNALAWAIAEALEKEFGAAGTVGAQNMVLDETLNDAEAFRLTLGFGNITPHRLNYEHITLD